MSISTPKSIIHISRSLASNIKAIYPGSDYIAIRFSMRIRLLKKFQGITYLEYRTSRLCISHERQLQDFLLLVWLLSYRKHWIGDCNDMFEQFFHPISFDFSFPSIKTHHADMNSRAIQNPIPIANGEKYVTRFFNSF